MTVEVGTGIVEEPRTLTVRESFLLRAEHEGESERNLAAFRQGLDRVTEFLEPRSLEDFRAEDVEPFMQHLADRGVSESAKASFRRVLTAWLAHLQLVRSGVQFVVEAEEPVEMAEPKAREVVEPLNLGFDVNVGGASFGAPGSYYGEQKYGLGTRRAHNAVPHLEKYHGTKTFLSEALTIEAKKHVAATVKSGKPFFLYFAHYAVHAPFESDPRFAAHYENSDKPKNAKAFATLIEGMDKSLNDMLDQLDELGVAEDTLVIFLGDNGSDAPLGHQHDVACAAPLRGKKGAHYEGGMRVPFIAAWAKSNATNPNQKKLRIPAGKIQAQVANVTDLFPTILNVTATESPDGHNVDGKLLNTLLTGKRDCKRKEQFLMHYPHGPHRSNYFTTWRDGDWKVIYHNFPDRPPLGGKVQSAGARYELFNLKSDPFESTNVADKNPKQLKKMMRGLVAQMKAHNALNPIGDNGKSLEIKLP